jgi:hypothetical protein
MTIVMGVNRDAHLEAARAARKSLTDQGRSVSFRVSNSTQKALAHECIGDAGGNDRGRFLPERGAFPERFRSRQPQGCDFPDQRSCRTRRRIP